MSECGESGDRAGAVGAFAHCEKGRGGGGGIRVCALTSTTIQQAHFDGVAERVSKVERRSHASLPFVCGHHLFAVHQQCA